MSLVQTVFAGDTTDVWDIGLVLSAPGASPKRYAALDNTFSCWLAVENAVPPIAREITAKDTAGLHFLAWLTPAETLALGPGRHRVGIELRNLAMVPPLTREQHAVVVILPGLVPPA